MKNSFKEKIIIKGKINKKIFFNNKYLYNNYKY